MEFVADLHIHSRFSRATSKQCDLPHLHAAAKRKGITVVGTGDFTHPGWLEELTETLVEAEEGLYRLGDEDARKAEAGLPHTCDGTVRFLLSAEISNIYKKDGRTRKNHNLLLAPDLGSARVIHAALDRIGNVRSDGRPILGLDARDLLETVLEAAPGAVLIPAHVWTPWFSLFGSKSGFDALEACFEDLSDHIFALETGLSSDPPMNWRLSALDRYTLVSHSDAHSPDKLGREADLFDTALSFPAMRRALETREGFGGTLEFYPEEGKYHLDGHRNCSTRMTPAETMASGGLCLACGKPVTVGVLNRVDRLADRSEGRRPPGAPPFESLVPLREILSECLSVGPGSKKVQKAYDRLLEALGPELRILRTTDPADIETASTPLVAEAVRRVRKGEIRPQGGYDGEFGVIRVFDPGEAERLRGQSTLFALPAVAETVSRWGEGEKRRRGAGKGDTRGGERERGREGDAYLAPSPAASPLPLLDGRPETVEAAGVESGLNAEQKEAVAHEAGPLLVVAGPGTGKTRTVAHRIARLVEQGVASPDSILALTFTNQAAGTMRDRIRNLLPGGRAGDLTVCTFHSLCARLLRRGPRPDFTVLGEGEASALMEEVAVGAKVRKKGLAVRIALARREGLSPSEAAEDSRFDEGTVRVYRAYRDALASRGAVDFDGLLYEARRLLDGDDRFRSGVRDRHRWITVDEYQDINAAQYALLRTLAPEKDANLCVVGDPDQAIYGFRGADPSYFRRFTEDHPRARVVTLHRNYRSTETVLKAASQVMERSPERAGEPVRSGIEGERIVTPVLASERAEAEFVAHTIEKAMGGVSFFSRDTGRVEEGEGDEARSFSDFAVLYRTEAQGLAVEEAFQRLGLPHRRVGTNRLLDKPGFRTVYDALTSMTREEERSVAGVLQSLASGLTGAPADAARSLIGLAPPFGADLPAYLDHLALASEVDAFDPRADRIACMTLHASKGLEFPVVFILAVEDGVIPFRFGGKSDDLEEERRLFFVGVTRAKQRLYLCRAKKRRKYGKGVENPPSPFLEDIERVLLQKAALPDRPRKPKGPKQLGLFDQG
ncbi:MAG: UvrD-helicase domain-containing protein [Planctomycetota bacterium]|jgi:DNA helicase-2/ATP-dependent DNA helicase PcrA